MRHTTYLIFGFLLLTSAVSAQPVPHQSTGTPYDDEIYRHLVFNDYDNPGEVRRSWVLPYADPVFYIRLGGATDECDHEWRVTWREFHFWRAIIPIVAEQLTGTPYTQRVRIGCENIQPRYGWIIVNYVTPEEYLAEEGEEWGGVVGSTYGQIWMHWDGPPSPPFTYGNMFVISMLCLLLWGMVPMLLRQIKNRIPLGSKRPTNLVVSNRNTAEFFKCGARYSASLAAQSARLCVPAHRGGACPR